jgi:hypothetical protein
MTHLQIYEMATLSERERLSAQAERGYCAEGARISADPRFPVLTTVRRAFRTAFARVALGHRDADSETMPEIAPAARRPAAPIPPSV